MEYIKINSDEKIRGQRELLQSQIEILTILKRYQKYKILRKQESEMKNAFKRLVGEIEEELKIIEKHLPHGHKAYIKQPRQTAIQKTKTIEEIKERNELEMEINDIKQKLASLGYQ